MHVRDLLVIAVFAWGITACANGAGLSTTTPSTLGSASASSSPAATSAAASPSSTAPPKPSVVSHRVADAPNEPLRAELMARLAEDQAARNAELSGQDMNVVDRANTARMKEILDQHGWPGWSLVGDKASTAAWALVQHADLDLEFQETALAYLRGAVAAGDASPGDLAYLVDRVLVAKGQPQTYGTQFGAPIEDEANVDARRAASGLGTLAEYHAQFGGGERMPEESPTR